MSTKEKKDPKGESLLALAHLSSDFSLDAMLSGLEKTSQEVRATRATSNDGDSDGGGSKRSGAAPTVVSRRSAGKASVATRNSSVSRIDTVFESSIKQQAVMEAMSYGINHPSGAASETARRARSVIDASRDAAARVAAYNCQQRRNPYCASVTRGKPTRTLLTGSQMDTPCSVTTTPRSSTTPRSGNSNAQYSAMSISSANSNAREPRSTPLGGVYVGPRSERTAMRSRSAVQLMALEPGG